MKASAEVSEKVWFLNKRSGKIGSAALFSCHKNARVRNKPDAITVIVFGSVQPFSGPYTENANKTALTASTKRSAPK